MRTKETSSLIWLAMLVVAAVVLLFPSTALLSAQQPYRVLDRWKLGGDGFWDYMLADPSAHRLYITHGARLEVIDAVTGKPIGAVTGLHGIHGVALDTAGRYGYISDGGANAVVVFDRSSLATVTSIAVGTHPDGIVFEPATQTVWAFNGGSKDASVVDAATQKLVATIPLPGRPEFPAVDGQGTVFDNIEDKSEIVRLDAHARKLTAEWPAGCEGPSGLALDTAGHRLFAVCDKKMSVVDANSGKVIATPEIGDGPDAANYSPSKNLAFASCGAAGVLSVVDSSKPGYPTIESLPTQRGARTMTYDPDADRAYVVTAEFGPRPAPTAENPHPRPTIVPGSFTVLVIGR